MKSIDNSNGVVGSLKDGLDDILGIRDDIGATLMPTYRIIRTWSGNEPGRGTVEEAKTQILPSPRLVKVTDVARIVEGGSVQLGDIFLKMISKRSYPNKGDVDGTSDSQKIEKVYEVDGELYEVIDVSEKHLTWTIQIRKRSNQNRPPPPEEGEEEP